MTFFNEKDKAVNHDEHSQLDLMSSLRSNDITSNNEMNLSARKNIKDEKKKESSQDLKLCPEFGLILDTETTGLDPDKDKCLEVGSILFHFKSRKILGQLSFLMPVESNAAEAINKIPAEITNLRQPWLEGIMYFKSLLKSSDVIIAHNVEFDRKWFGRDNLPTISKPWICTMEDIDWPDEKQLRARPSVRDLALAYEVPVWNAHRALTDCIYLAEVFKRCEDLEKLLIYALEPRRLMRAEISYDQRHLAKNAGFQWNNPIRGAWTRKLSEREILKLNFSVKSVEI
tara:strand:+ start:42 stop:899 length:858 start_codon:yes stop_codon:yes gene_type:complete